MPDITMCLSKKCELSEICYRYRAIPTPYWQAYASFYHKDRPCSNFVSILEYNMDELQEPANVVDVIALHMEQDIKY